MFVYAKVRNVLELSENVSVRILLASSQFANYQQPLTYTVAR